jgi:hypothetical protein
VQGIEQVIDDPRLFEKTDCTGLKGAPPGAALHADGNHGDREVPAQLANERQAVIPGRQVHIDHRNRGHVFTSQRQSRGEPVCLGDAFDPRVRGEKGAQGRADSVIAHREQDLAERAIIFVTHRGASNRTGKQLL